MSHLAALCWLKWRLFRNAFARSKGRTNRVASLLTMVLALAFSLFVAGGMGFAAYAVLSEGRVVRRGSADLAGVVVVFMLLSAIYLAWATVPLSLGGGGQFAPGRLLLYPVRLGKLFVVDLLSELASLSFIFAAPAVCAIALGAGLARGSVGGALLVAAVAVIFGVALAKLLATSVGALTRRRRARGETVLALAGAAAAFGGILFGQAERFFSGTRTFPEALRWTPPGAVSVALTGGLRADGAGDYWFGVGLLVVYAATAIALTYRIAQRSLSGVGAGEGGGRKALARVSPAQENKTLAGWQLPLLSPQLSGVFEKELRYAMRNAQLRVMLLMPVVLTLSFSLINFGGRRGSSGGGAAALFAPFAPYMEGGRAAFSVLYVFMITSALSCNLFAYEGAGMRTLVLAPIARQTILAGKNLAALVVTSCAAVLVTIFNQLLYRDLSWRSLAFTALCFVIDAAAFTLVGNWLSIRFPKRLQFGRRMNASGMAGLLLLPIFVCVAALPALAVLGGYLARSTKVVYVILAAFAAIGVASYLLLINWQGRVFAHRELEILEAVTGRGDDEG